MVSISHGLNRLIVLVRLCWRGIFTSTAIIVIQADDDLASKWCEAPAQNCHLGPCIWHPGVCQCWQGCWKRSLWPQALAVMGRTHAETSKHQQLLWLRNDNQRRKRELWKQCLKEMQVTHPHHTATESLRHPWGCHQVEGPPQGLIRCWPKVKVC